VKEERLFVFGETDLGSEAGVSYCKDSPELLRIFTRDTNMGDRERIEHVGAIDMGKEVDALIAFLRRAKSAAIRASAVTGEEEK